jgi:DNA-binding PadR family transcriptional regulator
MRQDVEALEGSRDQLAFLVLRLIAEHSPCAETDLLSRVAGGDSDGEPNASASHAQGLICDALRKLKSLGLIEFVQEQIAITDEGRRVLEGSLRESASSQPQYSSKLVRPGWLAESLPRVKSVYQNCQGSAQAQWRKVAPRLAPGVVKLAGLLWRIAATSNEIAKRGIVVLGAWLRLLASPLAKIVQAVGLPTSKWLAHRYQFSLGGALLFGIFAAGVGGVMWNHRTEQGTPATQIASTEAAVATPIEKPKDPIETGSITPSAIEQPALTGDDASPAEVTSPVAEEAKPADPVVAAIQSKLKDSSFRSRAHSDDIAALDDFYAKPDAALIWVTDAGFSEKAKSIIGEISKAADWGLPQDGFDLPSADAAPATSEAKAADEVELDLAILKYARFARGWPLPGGPRGHGRAGERDSLSWAAGQIDHRAGVEEAARVRLHDEDC